MFSLLLKLSKVGRDGKFADATTNTLKTLMLQGFQNGVPVLFQREKLTFYCTRKKGDPQQQCSKNNPHFVNRLRRNACYTNSICITSLLITNNVKPNRGRRIKTSQRHQLLAITFHKVWSISDWPIFSKRYFGVCHAISRPQDNTIRWIHWLAYIPSRQ